MRSLKEIRDQADQMNNSGQILVVDDDQLILVFLSAVLSEEGYQVTCACDGRQAVELMRENRFDLVITDVTMPGDLNGLDVLRIARQIDPQYRVIIMTGYDYVGAADHVINKLGAVDYLPKPFNLTLITLTVAKALESKEMPPPVVHRVF